MIDTVAVALQGLRSEAPEGLFTSVMIETGLEDGYASVRTPIGDAWIAFNGRGISALVPVDTIDENDLGEVTGRPVHTRPMPASLADRVEEALRSGRSQRVPFDLRSVSDFARAVLSKAAEIPPGQVRPYGWVAREIGHPAAVRAVGTALARNPVPILIPCHRVVRSDNTVGQYAFGPARKVRLLEAEGLDVIGIMGRQHARFVGSRTTHIFCHPSCSRARRIRPQYRHEFDSEAQAFEAGYRPCRICRPIGETRSMAAANALCGDSSGPEWVRFPVIGR